MKFVQECYDRSDKLGREILEKYLINNGWEIVSNEENFLHDIIAKKDGKIEYFEVELKNKYVFTNRQSFKFPTVSFLGRKKKLHQKNPFYYIIICSDTNWALSIHSSDLFKEKYRQKLYINTENRKGEDIFYRVPKDQCKFFKL